MLFLMLPHTISMVYAVLMLLSAHYAVEYTALMLLSLWSKVPEPFELLDTSNPTASSAQTS